MKTKKQIKSLNLSKQIVSNFTTSKIAGGIDTNQRSCYYTIYWCKTTPPICTR
jgi:hypothetical protein